MHIACIALLCLFLLPRNGSAEGEACLSAFTKGHGLRVRGQPRDDGTILGKLPRGEELAVRIFDSEWVEILEGKFEGRFANRKLLRLEGSPSPACRAQELEAVVARNFVNLRATPSLGAKVLQKRVPKGSKLVVKAAGSSWYEVQFPDSYRGAFLRKDLLEIEDIALPDPTKISRAKPNR